MWASAEQVERLRERSGASYTDCSEALQRSGGDILEALLDLERQGKSATGAVGGAYTTRPGAAEGAAGAGLPADPARSAGKKGAHFNWEALLRKVVNTLVNIFRNVSANRLEVWRGEELFTSVPVAVVLLLVVVAFWIAILLLVLALILGCRYRFVGPDVDSEPVNDVMDNVSDAMDDIMSRVKAEIKKHGGKTK